jgi:hypothetical protein
MFTETNVWTLVRETLDLQAHSRYTGWNIERITTSRRYLP